ncbi:uncharacterized protein LOC142231407 [Haematobia irritans]|uniref:uncharacterized protein LOC142231407 n=1 Tax=Haematobia irritans TaxID=7368 RepID=UPI003F507EA9
MELTCISITIKFTIFLIVFSTSVYSEGYCRETLQDENMKNIQWEYLRQCLAIVSGETASKEMSENIWRLVKLAFDEIENVPAEAYKAMSYSLTAIPVEDLRNISFENIDIISVFGAIRTTMLLKEYQSGFNAEQLKVIASKVRNEWSGKNPLTYSEYDLRAMGEILCYLNVTDIENIHSDAFREAAEWIGLIENCPQDRLQAFANLALRSDAFGLSHKWSKLEVSIIGNILNGLPLNEINAIAKDKLQLNHFYKPNGKHQQHEQHQSSNKTKMNNSTNINGTNFSTTIKKNGEYNETI